MQKTKRSVLRSEGENFDRWCRVLRTSQSPRVVMDVLLSGSLLYLAEGMMFDGMLLSLVKARDKKRSVWYWEHVVANVSSVW